MSWTPSDELFRQRIDAYTRLIGYKDVAKRYNVTERTVKNWDEGKTKPSAARRRSIVRGQLAERRKQMIAAPIERRREYLQRVRRLARTESVQRKAQRELDAFEESVRRGQFQRVYEQRLKVARSQEDWEFVRNEYEVLMGNITSAERDKRMDTWRANR